MPKAKRNHDENLSKVCAICWNESGLKPSRVVSENEETAIQQFILGNYSRSDSKFPRGLCSTCQSILREWSTGKDNPRPLLLTENPNPNIPAPTRSYSPENCSCRICSRAQMHAGAWLKFKKGCKERRGLKVAKYGPKRKLCPQCLGWDFQGSGHSTSSCGQQQVLVANLMSTLDPKTREHLAHRTLSELANESGDSTVSLSGDTGGRPMTVTVGAHSRDEPAQLNSDEIVKIQLEANLTDRQLLTILKNLRIKFGHKAIAPHARQVLVDRKEVFDSFFTHEILEFEGKGGTKMQACLVFCHDLVDFIYTLAMLRDQSFPDLLHKIGFDGGKGHLKLTLTSYEPDNLDHVTNKRVKRADGIGAGNMFRETGVRKVQILAIVEKVPESYQNCQLILQKVNVVQMIFHFAADLKMINIVGGLMCHSATCPCSYCEAKCVKGKWEENADKAELRSFGNIVKNFNAWVKSGGAKKDAKDYKNCTNLPLLFDENDDPETLMLLISPPPSLHLKLGFNKFLDTLAAVWPEVLDWTDSLGIFYEPYNGGALEGNEVNKVMQHLDRLESIIPTDFLIFVETMKAFSDVVDSCFGFELDPLYEAVIKKFSDTFDQLQAEFSVSKTVKFHIVNVHVPQFIKMTGKPLGQYSKQEVENAHSRFAEIWKNYLVKNPHASSYVKNYVKAVMNFNANHI